MMVKHEHKIRVRYGATGKMSVSGQRVTFQTDILDEKEKIVNKGTVTLAFVDMKTRETIATPRILQEKIGAALK